VIEVVAVTPLIFVVIIPLEAVTILELIILADSDTPFTEEVRVLIAEIRLLSLIKDPVVVACLPFTVEVRVKVLVEVEMVKVLEVEEATSPAKSVVVATPLITVVKFVPSV